MRVVLFLIASSNMRPGSWRAPELVSLALEVAGMAAARDPSGILVVSLSLRVL